jgi:hypothetical protein
MKVFTKSYGSALKSQSLTSRKAAINANPVRRERTPRYFLTISFTAAMKGRDDGDMRSESRPRGYNKQALWTE